MALTARADVRDADLEARFFEEAPKGWAALEAASARLDALGIQSESKIEAGQPIDPDHRHKLVYKVNGPMMLYDSRNTKIGSAKVLGVNSDYTFTLNRENANASFAIGSIGDPKETVTANADRTLRKHIHELTCNTFHMPWKIAAKPFREMIAEPGFELEAVSNVERDGERLVRITFDYDPADPHDTAVRGGWILFAPQRSWVQVESQINASWGGLYLISVSYDKPNSDGLPVVTRIVETKTDKNRRKGTIKTTNFERWDYRPVPEREFTLTAYDLPEIEDRGVSPSSRGIAWYWFLVGGLILGLIAIFFAKFRTGRV